MKHCFYFYFLNIYLFTCLGWVLVAAHEILRCSLWDPVSWPGTEHGPPALGARSLSHQITKEVPVCNFLNQYLLTFNNSFHQGLFSAALWLTHFFLDSFIFTCLLYDFYDAIYNSSVEACGDLASLLTDSWLGTGLRSRVTQSQRLATSVQWTSRLHICC